MIAVVLAGGQSRRFGSEKGLAPFKGRAMISWALDAVSTVTEKRLIISNRPELYSGFGSPVYPDMIKGMGPLSGLHTAFEVTGASELFLLACDMPLVCPAMVGHVISKAASFGGEAVIPLALGREQGMLAVYRRSAIERNMARILRGSILFDEFRRGLNRLLIEEDELSAVEGGLRSFENVNSVEDMLRLERLG